jgi:hypothetical protein
VTDPVLVVAADLAYRATEGRSGATVAGLPSK